jgi:hypothetical protein
MKCKDIKKLLNSYIDNELSEKDVQRVRIHLQECIDCAEETAELDKVKEMMHCLPKLQAPHGLAEAVREKIITIKQPERSIFWRYSWVIGSFSSAAALFLLAYIIVIDSVKYQNYPAPAARESVGLEKAKPSGDVLMETMVFEQNRLLKSEKDEPLAISQNIQITTNDVDDIKNKINEAKESSLIGDLESQRRFFDKRAIADPSGERAAKNKELQDVTDGKIANSKSGGFVESRKPENLKHQVQKASQKYVVKVSVPLSKKDTFVQNLKNNIPGQITFSDVQVASQSTLMMGKALADEITERNKELSEVAVKEAGTKEDNAKKVNVLVIIPNEPELSRDVAAQPADKGNTIKPSAPAQASPSTQPQVGMAPPSSATSLAPSAPIYTRKIEEGSAKEKAPSDKLKEPAKGKDVEAEKKMDKDMKDDEQGNISREDKSDRLGKPQDSKDEIMIEFTIVIEEKTE